MRPLRATPCHYLLTPGQLDGDEAFDPNGATDGTPAAGAGSSRGGAGPEVLVFCAEGRRLGATRAVAGGGCELLLWDLSRPNRPWARDLEPGAPPRPTLAPCPGGGLDVQLAARTLHWRVDAAPSPCSARAAEDAQRRAFADWVASTGFYDVADGFNAPPTPPEPLFATGAATAWRAALVDRSLLFEYPGAAGEIDRDQHHASTSANLGQPLALWFGAGAVLWLTTTADSAAGGSGRVDLWRLALDQLEAGLGAREVCLGSLHVHGLAAQIDPTGRFAAVASQDRRRRGAYIVDCSAVRPRFLPLRLPRGPSLAAAPALSTASPDHFAFAPEGRHLLVYASANDPDGPAPNLFVLPDDDLALAPRGLPLAPFAADHGGRYALGPGGRTLAHAPGMAGAAAVVVYALTDGGDGGDCGEAATAPARRKVATSSR